MTAVGSATVLAGFERQNEEELLGKIRQMGLHGSGKSKTQAGHGLHARSFAGMLAYELWLARVSAGRQTQILVEQIRQQLLHVTPFRRAQLPF